MTDLLARLNPAQRAAVTHEGGSVLLSSSPGSGKTRTLVTRAAWLIQRGVSPSAILGLTFSRKAANELRERLAHFVGPAARGLWAGTFHAYGALLCRQHAGLIGRSANFSVLDRDDTKRALRRLAREQKLTDDVSLLAELIERVKRRGTEALHTIPSTVAGAVLALLPAYQDVLRTHDALDFSDLLLVPLRLLREHPSVRRALQARYVELLIDEGQDLEAAQHELVELLALPIDPARPAPVPTCTLAADPDQAVYGWRGASAERLLQFVRIYSTPAHPARIINLGENYRSTPEILAPAARVIAHNRHRLPKPLTTANPSGPAPEVLHFANDREEAEAIADLCEQWIAEGLAPVAVLARIGAVLPPVARACEYRGLPVELVADLSLVDRKEIRDLLAYLRVLVHPTGDWSAYERVLGVPPRGIGPKTLTHLQQGVIRQGVEATFREAAARHAGLARLLATLDDLRATLQGPAATLRRVIEAIEYREYLSRRVEPDETERRWGHVEEFLDLAEAWEARRGTDIRAFLDDLVLSEADETDSKLAQVQLLTLHGAKGGEWGGVVFLAAEEGLIPHLKHLEGDEVEEERRLFYVGVTRAQSRLVLTTTKERMLWGRTWNLSSSRFLAEAALI